MGGGERGEGAERSRDEPTMVLSERKGVGMAAASEANSKPTNEGWTNSRRAVVSACRANTGPNVGQVISGIHRRLLAFAGCFNALVAVVMRVGRRVAPILQSEMSTRTRPF